jgi:SAM-dependent methyltransferase
MKHRLIGRVYEGEEITWRSSDTISDIQIGLCEDCGFHHTFPYPSDSFLKNYYQNYQIPCPLHIEERNRIAKLISSRVDKTASIIDIGCGNGEMLEILSVHGFKSLYGSEFGGLQKEIKRNDSATILSFDINELCDWCINEKKTFDCAILINVFEHVPEPIALMKRIRRILSPNGMIMFIVPNDFSVLQTVYLEKTKRKPWFLILPDHINFFSLDTIDDVMKKAGYDIIGKTVQYPLEFFLLQGDDYVAMPRIGKDCHNKRVVFEKAFFDTGRNDDLENIYRGFADIGIGRDMYIFARPK